ncbi:hypothetical protein AB7M35_003149 [Amorphus suaedae]
MARPDIGAEQQLPNDPGAVFLDHIGHFVADHDAAAEALVSLGFAPTPWTVQTNPDPDGGPARLTGTGNRCVMFRQGYLEVLAKTADTPLAREFDRAVARYRGVHLIAFGTADAAAERARLAEAGFAVQPMVDLRRKVEDGSGAEVELAFSVARVVAGEMEEGRIQFLTHRTEQAMWQPQMLDHPNGAESLTDQILVVADLEQATERWERFLARPSTPVACGRTFRLERGRITLCSVAHASMAAPGDCPAPPAMVAYGVGVADLAPLQACLDRAGIVPLDTAPGRVTVAMPEALGVGVIHFLTAEADPPWLRGA